MRSRNPGREEEEKEYVEEEYVIGEVRTSRSEPWKAEIISDHPWEFMQLLWPILSRPTRDYINRLRTDYLKVEPWPEPEVSKPWLHLAAGSLSELFLEGGEYCG